MPHMQKVIARLSHPLTNLILLSVIFVSGGCQLAACQSATAAQNDEAWKSVEQALGRTGQMQPGAVIKFSMPRKDMHITLEGVELKAGFALGSWVAFQHISSGAMVMGDLVLTEQELQPVMLKLQEGGIQEAAIHNHLLGEQPRVIYMHISSEGDPVQMAKAIHDAVALTRTPALDSNPSLQSATDLGFDQKQVEEALGRSGKVNGGILQFSASRAETITDHGMRVPPSMGVATGINFQPTGAGKAAITGDFVLIASEVNPVIKALRQNGINVTALHSHMLTEEPRLFFMHFWAHDDALKLAKGLRAALDITNSSK